MRIASALLLAALFALPAAWALPAGEAPGGAASAAGGRGVPAVAFTEPSATLLNGSLVVFRGTVSDTDAVRAVELSRDGLNWTPATDLGGAVPFSNWTCTLWLPEGTHNVTARANDTAGSEGRAVLGLAIDLTAPALVVDTPQKDLLTNRTMLPVAGRTEPGATVRVGSEPAAVLPDGSFNATARLVPGANLVEVRSRDPAGNEAVETFNVFLDAVPPSLNAWATVTLTNRTSVPVFGETEQGAVVSVAGVDVPVGLYGNFSASVDLVPGMNRVTVSARDRAQNYNFAVVEVVLDATAPSVLITRPAGMAVVSDPVVEVCGTASDGSGIAGVQVGVDDQNYTLAGGNTSWRGTVRLPAGTHNISVLVFDRAGNSNRTHQTITYLSSVQDLLPPALVISSPLPDSRAGQRVRVRGLASDPSGVSSVQAGLDNRTWRQCTQNAARTEWWVNLSLRNGWNTIYVRAYDTRGNNATRTVEVEYVAPPPPRPPDYALYAGSAAAAALVVIGLFIGINFWRKWSDQPEPGLGEDAAVVEIPAKGLK
jgi:hypothetical protein